MKGHRKFVISVVMAMLLFLLMGGTALAAWPSGSQGDQYAAVNSAMTSIAAEEGISPETFVAIYNAAAAGELFADLSERGNGRLATAWPFRPILASLSGSQASTFTEDEVNAACRVMSRLTSYRSVLVDYDTVYNNLSCGTRLVSAGPTRGTLPKTGIAAVVLSIIGVIGVGSVLIYKKKSVKPI